MLRANQKHFGVKRSLGYAQSKEFRLSGNLTVQKRQQVRIKQNYYMTYLSSVFTVERLHNIPAASLQPIPRTTLSTILITPDVVKQKLVALNPNKTPGDDTCHPFSLRELADEICEPLAALFN